MSDTTNNYGPVVNMNDGQGNVGINYGTVGGAPVDRLRAAVEELTRRRPRGQWRLLQWWVRGLTTAPAQPRGRS